MSFFPLEGKEKNFGFLSFFSFWGGGRGLMKRHGGGEKERCEERRGSEGGREKGGLQEAYQANSAEADAWKDGWVVGARVPTMGGLRGQKRKEETEGPIGGWRHRISLERTRNTYPSLGARGGV
ncbi:hypothetical protein KC324_g81 [Hortaea werneckii]|nr:hypothetical protein KC324_g81 [Hortaea werneckii]